VRRAAVLALVTGLVVLPAGQAQAHARADVAFVRPRAAQTVSGGTIDIVLQARSKTGTGVAEFTLTLDGQPVDVNGRVGPRAAFTSLSLLAGKRMEIRIDAPPPGRHELRIRYAPDAHDDKADVVRRFTVSPPPTTPPPSTPAATEPPPPTDAASVGPAFATARPDLEPAGSSRPLLVGGLVAAAAIAGAVVAFAAVRRLRRGGIGAAGGKPSS
jgi:hypothetical protein